MTIIDYADRIAWDCFNAPASFFDSATIIGEASSGSPSSSNQASSSNASRPDPNNLCLPYGWTSMDNKTLFLETRKLHVPKKTERRDSGKKASRRACSICKSRMSLVCSNFVCMGQSSKENRCATNEVPLCDRPECIDEHVHKLVQLHCNKDLTALCYAEMVAAAIAAN